MERGVPLGSGLDHEAYLVDGHLVVRHAKADPAEVEREARLLETVAQVAPVPVPRPTAVDPKEGWLAYERLDGVPLIDVPAETRVAHAARLGAELGAFVRALRDADVPIAERDDTSPNELLAEARDNYAAVKSALPASDRATVEAFLAAAPPPPATELAFCHNDLAIEHVLVAPDALQITGVIDWSDAALADPARDLGLILRDLGTSAFDAAMADHDEELRTRAIFHARCALLEDLVFGLTENRSEYADKSQAGLAWTFPSAL
jgi:aminoglycoside phosphotransferase (APT) family kinase protein